jgi:hypothetical protein
MNLEDIMVTEISQLKGQILYDSTYEVPSVLKFFSQELKRAMQSYCFMGTE